MCYCENSFCREHSLPAGCDNKASEVIGCEFIGNICEPCAEYMPENYLYIKL